MADNLYITGAEFGSGKSIVVLAMMELLSSRAGKVGFFRPVISGRIEDEPLSQLIISRYQLPFPYSSLYGCTRAEAQTMIAAGDYDQLLKRIMVKYKALEWQCDQVLCVGTDFTGVSSALEFDFNADMANNLGCPLMPVVRGAQRNTAAIIEATTSFQQSLDERGCDIMAMVVNRVERAQLAAVEEQLKATLPPDVPFYVVPEEPGLGKPTIGDIARSLKADTVCGSSEAFNREVHSYKVAAMELPAFLEHLEENALIITSGDRADIILGSLLAHNAETYPQIAGLLLTGGLTPPPSVIKLLNGLEPFFPVLSVGNDTFATAMAISPVDATLTPDNERRLAIALGIVEAGFDRALLEAHLATKRPTRVTPLMFEYELIQRAKENRQRIVLPEGTDPRILRAAEILTLRDVAELTLLGDPDEIKAKAAELGVNLERIHLVNPLTSEWRERYADTYYALRQHKGISRQMAYDTVADVSYFGTMMVHHEQADGMVSGAVNTTQHTIRPAFEIIRTQPGSSIVSSVFFMCLEDRVLVYGDCAINPNPNAEQLADIALSSADTAEMFGVEPRIAMLSYSTGSSGKGEAVDKVSQATRLARQKRPGLKLEGPIQYDAAVDASVARSKMPGSEVAGHATVFIFPDLNTGNNTYKAVQRSADAVAVGPVLQGLNKPVNDLSRGCTVTDIVNTVAITAIQAQGS